MLKKYVVLQDGIKECGAACLLSIIKYYKGNVSLNYLLEITNTNKNGTNFYELSKGAQEIGFQSKGYKINNINEMLQYNNPFICQIKINNYNHFVVVYKIQKNKITVMDPAKGMIVVNQNKFNEMFTGNILLLEPIKKMPVFNDNNYLLKVIQNIIIINKKLIIKILSLTILVIIFTCLYSYYFKIIIDNIIFTNKSNLLMVSIIFIIIVLLREFSEFLRNNLLLYLNKKLDLSIITTTINKIISLPYSYYKNKTTGEIISRVNDLLYIKNVVSKFIITLFLDTILSLAVLIILFKINRNMTLLLLLITIIYLFIYFIFKNPIKKYTNIMQENNAKVNSFLVESISSYNTIKGLNLEKEFINKINKQYLYLINDNCSFAKITNFEELIKNLCEGIIVIIIIYIGSSLIMDKSLTIGNLITYNSLLYYYLNPVKNLLNFYKELYYVKNSINNINNILNYKYESLDTNSNLRFDNNIRIKQLNFNYNCTNRVIDNISLNIPANSKVLILGSSGSGKSTLLKIIYKYYEIERDKIYFGNYDINDFTTSDIRRNITYISQDELLYTDTIKNNIILNRNIQEDKLIEICKLTCVTDILIDNNFSYDYPLEENGANLSGGQKQRIILARALLKESKIILIDEGLNEIDVNLERKILKNIFSYYNNKTIIIVSHRLDNMDLYDMTVTLNSGRIEKTLVKHE